MHKLLNSLLTRLFTSRALRTVAYTETVADTLQDAIARTCIDNVADWGIPRTLQAWNNRQIVIAADVAARFGVDVLDVLPRVALTFPKVCPRVYDRSLAERLAHTSLIGSRNRELGRVTAVRVARETWRTLQA